MRTIVQTLRDYWLSVVVIVVIGGALAVLAGTKQSKDAARSEALAAAAWNQRLAKAAAAGSASDAAFQQAVARQAGRQAQQDQSMGSPAGGSSASASTRPKSSAVSSSTGSAGSYVDCAALGHAVSTSDPVGDVDASGNAQVAARFRSVDLTHVTVAVAGGTLCADFTSVAPPDARTFYSLFLSQNEPNSASIRIDVGPPWLAAQRAVLKYPGADEAVNHGIVPAKVGGAGNSTSVLIDRGVLPSFTPFPRFLWNAEAVGQTGLMSPQQVFDYAPDGHQPAYP